MQWRHKSLGGLGRRNGYAFNRCNPEAGLRMLLLPPSHGPDPTSHGKRNGIRRAIEGVPPKTSALVFSRRTRLFHVCYLILSLGSPRPYTTTVQRHSDETSERHGVPLDPDAVTLSAFDPTASEPVGERLRSKCLAPRRGSADGIRCAPKTAHAIPFGVKSDYSSNRTSKRGTPKRRAI